MLQFLLERADIAKYSSREQLDLLEHMFVQTLSLNVGSIVQDYISEKEFTFEKWGVDNFSSGSFIN